jgi:hypothetical protein
MALMKSRLRTQSSNRARQSFFKSYQMRNQWEGRLVRFGSKADVCSAQGDVRQVPQADLTPSHHCRRISVACQSSVWSRDHWSNVGPSETSTVVWA